MYKARLEAFTDGVLAIVLTIMVLEMKVPLGEDFSALIPLWPTFLSYVLSFIYVGIYWVNHHNLLQASGTVTGPVLLANLNLLFWLSLFPFTTGWMGSNHFAPFPVGVYGLNLLIAALSYHQLQASIATTPDMRFWLQKALGRNLKGKVSILAYALGAGVAFLGYPIAGFIVLAGVAAVWIVPDRRLETVVEFRNEIDP